MAEPPPSTRAELEARIERIKQTLRWEKDPHKREHLIDDLVETTIQIMQLKE